MQLEYTPRWEMALQGLPASDIARIESCLTPRVFKPRSLLYEEGVVNSHVYILTAGRVRTFYVDVNGREFTNRVSGTGALIGIIASMADAPAQLSVQALDHVSALALANAALKRLLHEIPLLSFNLNRLLAVMYREQLTRRKRAGDSAPVRLGKVLCSLAAMEAPAPGGPSGEIRGLTHQDLAKIVGTSRTWVSLMLGEFEAQGLIRRKPGRIAIVDNAAFERFVMGLESGE